MNISVGGRCNNNNSISEEQRRNSGFTGRHPWACPPSSPRSISPSHLSTKTKRKYVRRGGGAGGQNKKIRTIPPKLHEVPLVDLSNCKYEVLRIILQKKGWEESHSCRNCHLIWTDMSVGPEKLMQLQKGQKINHFHGMLQICRKKSLARNLSVMHKMFPQQYTFFPRAYILPNQLHELLACFNFSKLSTFILKPDNGCQGRGVVLAQSGADVRAALEGLAGANLLAQRYLINPMLLNGYKFDLRIYALIISCDPLRLYLYRDGIVRFCTEKYMRPDAKNLRDTCMHLTNYALNKRNAKFQFNFSSADLAKGHKWSLSALFQALSEKGFDTKKLYKQISQIVVMTVLSIVPLLVHNCQIYLGEHAGGRSCFELLGMDVLLDNKCTPWLLEVNHSPSFSIETPLDLKVKEALLTDTFNLVNVDTSTFSRFKSEERQGAQTRLSGEGQPAADSRLGPNSYLTSCDRTLELHDNYEMVNKGKYDRVYPVGDKHLQSLYDLLLTGAQAAFKHSVDSKAMSTLARVQAARNKEEASRQSEEKKRKQVRLAIRKKAQKSALLAALAGLAAKSKGTSSSHTDSSGSWIEDRASDVPATLCSGISSVDTTPCVATPPQNSEHANRTTEYQKIPTPTQRSDLTDEDRSLDVPTTSQTFEQGPTNVDRLYMDEVVLAEVRFLQSRAEISTVSDGLDKHGREERDATVDKGTPTSVLKLDGLHIDQKVSERKQGKLTDIIDGSKKKQTMSRRGVVGRTVSVQTSDCSERTSGTTSSKTSTTSPGSSTVINGYVFTFLQPKDTVPFGEATNQRNNVMDCPDSNGSGIRNTAPFIELSTSAASTLKDRILLLKSTSLALPTSLFRFLICVGKTAVDPDNGHCGPEAAACNSRFGIRGYFHWKVVRPLCCSGLFRKWSQKCVWRQKKTSGSQNSTSSSRRCQVNCDFCIWRCHSECLFS